MTACNDVSNLGHQIDTLQGDVWEIAEQVKALMNFAAANCSLCFGRAELFGVYHYAIPSAELASPGAVIPMDAATRVASSVPCPKCRDLRKLLATQAEG